jgi:hypothetical protein
VFSQSETILSDKRRVYEDFLRSCPAPNDAYRTVTDEILEERAKRFQQVQGPLLLYAAPSVVVALNLYLEAFGKSDAELNEESPALHPLFREAAKAQNDLILEMRRDALAWSAFAYTGATRLPKNAIDSIKSRLM